MPREQINFPPKFEPRTADGTPDDNTPAVFGETWPSPIIHVSWVAGRDFSGHVQMAFEVSPTYLKYVAEEIERPPGESPHVYSPALTREDLNRLIRVLRRARDQAYGKDE